MERGEDGGDDNGDSAFTSRSMVSVSRCDLRLRNSLPRGSKSRGGKKTKGQRGERRPKRRVDGRKLGWSSQIFCACYTMAGVFDVRQ